MERPIRPEWLLRQADELGYRRPEKGQPRNANLRRAVSAAYYALFHSLALAMAEHLLPEGSREERYALTRSVTHDAIRVVCQWVTQRGSLPSHASQVVDRAAANQDLVDVASAYVELREARHEADYDHLAAFNKPRTLNLVDLARDAVEKLALARDGDPEAFQSFVTLLALRTTVR